MHCSGSLISEVNLRELLERDSDGQKQQSTEGLVVVGELLAYVCIVLHISLLLN